MTSGLRARAQGRLRAAVKDARLAGADRYRAALAADAPTLPLYRAAAAGLVLGARRGTEVSGPTGMGRVRRPRAVWLLDSPAPTGAAVMALRRIAVSADRLASTVLVARTGAPAGSPLGGSPLAGTVRAGSLAGEALTARARVVVTTSEATLAWAAPRVVPGARLVHYVHTPVEAALTSRRFLDRVRAAAAVVLPGGADAADFAARAGLDRATVTAEPDFVPPGELPASPGTGRVVLVVGGLADPAVLDLVHGFRLAALPGWQLRIAGDGPYRSAIELAVAESGVPGVEVVGWQTDVRALYADAGLVARFATDAYGLPVVEALAAGLPVLASHAVPAARELVTDGINGLVLGRTDPGAVADALTELTDDARRAHLAAGARATALPRPSGLPAPLALGVAR